MAEFCLKCFIYALCPTEDEISRVVMSEDLDLCECCGEIKQVVDYVKESTISS